MIPTCFQSICGYHKSHPRPPTSCLRSLPQVPPQAANFLSQKFTTSPIPGHQLLVSEDYHKSHPRPSNFLSQVTTIPLQDGKLLVSEGYHKSHPRPSTSFLRRLPQVPPQAANFLSQKVTTSPIPGCQLLFSEGYHKSHPRPSTSCLRRLPQVPPEAVNFLSKKLTFLWLQLEINFSQVSHSLF